MAIKKQDKKTKQKQTKQKPKTLKAIKPSWAIEKSLTHKLYTLTKEINENIKNALYFTSYSAFETPIVSKISTALNEVTKYYEVNITEKANSVATSFLTSLQKAVDSNFIAQGFIFGIAKSIILTNTLKSNYEKIISLIHSIPADIINAYKQELLNGVADFDRQKIANVAKNVAKKSKRKAELIARDQTHKASVNYAMARAMDLGFEYYVWDTSHDERVSKGKGGHNKLQGRIFRFDTDTAIVDASGNKGHCGTRVNCRCVPLTLINERNEKLKLIKDGDAGDYYILTK